MEWKEIPGFTGYQASDDGRIRSIDREIIRKTKHGDITFRMKGKELKQFWSGKYLCVSMRTDRYPNRMQRPEPVHRLICLAFFGLPKADRNIARHLDDNPNNNHLSNLSWGSYSDNMKDSWKNGHMDLRLKLPIHLHRNILLEYNSGLLSQKEIASKYGISQGRVSQIVGSFDDLSYMGGRKT
jgi:predicted XRE-type DNA-binding protein